MSNILETFKSSKTHLQNETLWQLAQAPPSPLTIPPNPPPFRWKSRITICPEKFFAVRQTGKFLHNWKGPHNSIEHSAPYLDAREALHHTTPTAKQVHLAILATGSKERMNFCESRGCWDRCRQSWPLLVRNYFPKNDDCQQLEITKEFIQHCYICSPSTQHYHLTVTFFAELILQRLM